MTEDRGRQSRILLLTGERQVGKTTALRRALPMISQAGLSVSGLLTRRTGPHDLEVQELHTGAVYSLTDPYDTSSPSPLSHFRMNPVAMARSAHALQTSFPASVFIVDELGPLEFKHRQGWVDAVALLKREAYQSAVVVVRPSLVGQAVVEFAATVYTVVSVTPANRDRVPALIVRHVAAAGAQVAAEGEGV